jgi:nucleoid-associated protein YgaU
MFMGRERLFDCFPLRMTQSIEELKQKYQSAIDLAKNSGHLENVNMQGEKLFIRAEVANEELKNAIWNEIKNADPQYSDLTADIQVNSSLPLPAAAGRKYTVQAGESLSAIAQKFYGKANEYNRIFEANKDKLRDPDHVQAGQELVIPG